jgi:tetratricopeptide (TPR) repeat protein
MADKDGLDELAALEQIAASRSDSVEDIQNLADAYAELGRWEDASRAYRAAIRLEPEDANLYNSLATVYAELGDAGEAERAYQKAIELRPDDSMPYYNLGLLYEEQQRTEEAFQAYAKCLQYSSDLDERSAVRDRLVQMQPERQLEVFVANWRLALAGVYGLVAALALGYAWYLLANATGRMYGYAALLLGLVVGVVVNFMSGGIADVRYGILGALLSGVGVGFGEFLIHGLPDSKYHFEFSFTDLLFFALAVYEGWVMPQRPLSFLRRKHHLINERNRKPVFVAGIVVLVLVLGLGARAGLLPSSKTVRAKQHFDRATELFEAGKVDEARAECEKALELEPDYAGLHHTGTHSVGPGELDPGHFEPEPGY